MESMATTSIQSIGVRYGIISAVAMIAYFLVINLLGLQDSEIIRFGSNIFILLAVVMAIGTLKRSYDALNKETPYLPGLAIGFLVGLLGSGLYAAFILIHAIFISPDYAGVLHNRRSSPQPNLLWHTPAPHDGVGLCGDTGHCSGRHDRLRAHDGL
jgi:hypothetical protein